MCSAVRCRSREVFAKSPRKGENTLPDTVDIQGAFPAGWVITDGVPR